MQTQLVLYCFLFVGIYSEEIDEDERKDMADSDIDKAEITEIQQLLDIDNVTNSEQVLKQKYDEDINSYMKLFDFQKSDAPQFDFEKFEVPRFDSEELFRMNEDQTAKLNEDLRKAEEEETRRKEEKDRDLMIKLLIRLGSIGILLILIGVANCVLKHDRRKKADDEEKILDTSESDSAQPISSAPQEI